MTRVLRSSQVKRWLFPRTALNNSDIVVCSIKFFSFSKNKDYKYTKKKIGAPLLQCCAISDRFRRRCGRWRAHQEHRGPRARNRTRLCNRFRGSRASVTWLSWDHSGPWSHYMFLPDVVVRYILYNCTEVLVGAIWLLLDEHVNCCYVVRDVGRSNGSLRSTIVACRVRVTGQYLYFSLFFK